MEQKLSKIKAFVFDVDGVMTDGTILALPDGDLLRTFDAKDGFAFRMASMHGYQLCAITGGSSESIRKRLVTCGFKTENVYIHSRNKILDFNDFCQRNNVAPEEVLYIGDDMPDVCVMELCGLAVAPADACSECIEVADYVSPRPGGKGCVRHSIEMVMKTQGTWTLDTEVYKARF